MEVKKSDNINILFLLPLDSPFVSASASSPQVLSVLCVLSSSWELQWRDGVQALSQEEVLLHLLALTQKSAHRLEKTHSNAQIILNISPKSY